MFIFNGIRLVLLSMAMVLLTSFSLSNKPPKYQIKTVVIDPGHGGHDSGCLGSSSMEKHIALAVSLKLGDLIEKYFPDVRVIYTRKTDVFVPLHERANIANRNKADLFICIHCNAGPSTAYGAETFVMGLHKTDDNLAVARRENESALLEKDYQMNYEGYDPKSPEAYIIFSLYQNTYMEQSLAFASKLQQEFEYNSKRYNRGVKQAGFLVLYRTAMPSVLIELGFLTNKNDEKFLATQEGQSSMANSILRAFTDYKSETERKAGGGGGDLSNIGSGLEIPPEKPKDKPVVKSNPEPTPKNNPSKPSPSDSAAAAAPIPKDTTAIIVADIIKNNPPLSETYFTIQIGALAESAVKKGNKYEQVRDSHSYLSDDNMRRYFVGRFGSQADAESKLADVKGQGFKDAFVCAINKGRKISLKEAEALLKTK
ncbi:MAG: N-acetylmuramoyl-L-alanine amidase [Bacteroidota bacterium]